MIEKTGVSVMTEMKDIKVEQIMPLFNILTSQKNFSASGFVTSAQLHKEDKEKTIWSSEDWNKDYFVYLAGSSDPTTNFETTNSKFHDIFFSAIN